MQVTVILNFLTSQNRFNRQPAALCFALLLLLCCLPQRLLPQGLGTKQYNFATFTVQQKSTPPALLRYSSPQAQQHPEFGLLPFNAPCQNCVELIDHRDRYTRFFIDPQHPGHTYSQQSYYALNYMDASGNWRIIDHRLRPNPAQPGVFTAPQQPVPVRIDLQHSNTALNLGSFEMMHNRNLTMYWLADKTATPKATATASYSRYTAGDDGVRVFNIWPGIDMEVFANQGQVETNFILLQKPAMPGYGYLVIEDHIALPQSCTLTKAGGLVRFMAEDLLLRDAEGYVRACMEHVRIRNAINMAAVTEYGIEKTADGYTVKMFVPCNLLDGGAETYPIVIDPIVSGYDSIGNFHSTGRPSANMNFTTQPGHCDYHMTVTVPGKSQLQGAYIDLEAQTTSNPHCGDTAFGINGHVCLKREILWNVICDTCRTNERFSCFYSTNCDTPGTLTSDPMVVHNGGPIPIPYSPFMACLPPQCPDYHIAFTLQNSDSSCEDQCGQLCAVGNMWRMTIEACQIDAYLTATDTNVCAGQFTTLTCHASCGVPPYHYVWNTGDTGMTIKVYPPAIGVDVVCTAYDACNNSVTSTDIVVNQIPAPAAEAGPDITLCEGGTVTLGGSPTATGGNIISWTASSSSAQSFINDTTAANPIVTVPYGTVDTALYMVHVSDGTCTTPDTVFVFSVPNPAAAIDTSGATAICNGQSVTLHVNGTYSSYLWSNGSTQAAITVSQPGPYYVIVTDNNGCKDTTGRVNIVQIAVPAISAYPDTTIFYGDSVQLYTGTALMPPAVDSFYWQPADSSISCVRCPQPIVAPLAAETYLLTVYTRGCTLTDSVVIGVILPDKYYIPDAFTPNGDGINDVFYLYGQSGVTVHEFKVYDRWGEKVHDGAYPWDGTYRGQLCQPGIYVYVFSVGLFGHLQDDVRKGSITLIR